MAMTKAQKEKLINMIDQISEQEVDRILASMHNFVDFIYYKARDIYNAIKDTISAVWSWIKSIFS
ncbi:hypothetical protein QUW02_12930 [Bacteroides eggerthii]|uniref:Uncharacterized protein n=1 Tax=Bacteroides eggerthii TaxID=28111 RepID=A0ABT7UAE0_9BACE|nr:hypothetical protein [Bacteroides eggerthii]